MTTLTFLTPIHESHLNVMDRAMKSVDKAMSHAPDDFDWIHRMLIDSGQGRSATRNALMEAAEGEYVMWLDADDEVDPGLWDVFRTQLLEKPHRDALWGAIYTAKDGIRDGQTYPMTFDKLLNGHPARTLNIGYIIRREIQARFPWNTDMDCGEDQEMYLRLWSDDRLSCTKVTVPIYVNHRGQHSTGERCATGADWRRVVTDLQNDWRARA